jgi:FtsH-binding integral membrane protein
MNMDGTSLVIIIGILVLVYMIYMNVTKQLTLKSYVTTNYMYIFGALLIMVFANYLMDKNGYDIMNLYNRILPLVILIFVCLFGILLTPTDSQLVKHLFWLGFIILNSILIYPVYQVAKEDNIIWKIMITMGLMFVGMSYIAYSQPLGEFDKWSPYLFLGLCGLLIFRSLDLLFADYSSKGFENRIWWYSIISIILFSGYLIYDTQKIMKDGVVLSKECIGKDHLECADYPSKSLGIILDLINLFTNFTNAFRKRN